MLLVTVMCCSIYKARAMPNDNYNFTVTTLLEAAGIKRSSCRDDECGAKQTDHIVELQLVVAALNRLPDTTHKAGSGWERRLVKFFDQGHNKQCLDQEDNQKKGTAVRKFIGGMREDMSDEDREQISMIRDHWRKIRDEFNEFRDSLDKIMRRHAK